MTIRKYITFQFPGKLVKTPVTEEDDAWECWAAAHKQAALGDAE